MSLERVRVTDFQRGDELGESDEEEEEVEEVAELVEEDQRDKGDQRVLLIVDDILGLVGWLAFPVHFNHAVRLTDEGLLEAKNAFGFLGWARHCLK